MDVLTPNCTTASVTNSSHATRSVLSHKSFVFKLSPVKAENIGMNSRYSVVLFVRKEIARKYDFLDDSRHSSITSPRSVPSEEAKSVSEKTPVISNSQIHKEYNREDISPKTRVLSTPVPLARKSREDLGKNTFLVKNSKIVAKYCRSELQSTLSGR